MSNHQVLETETNPNAAAERKINQHPLNNYHFSADELRVLRECNSESFFQRSVPFGIILGTSTYYGVRQGFLSPNAKYGATPKVVLSVIIGYFLGKFSYQRKCAEKMMALPNSRLGQLLRQKKQGGKLFDTFPNQNLGTGFGLPSFGSSSASDIYTDENLRSSKSNALDLDTERPIQAGLDDIYKPSLDNESTIADYKLETGTQTLQPSTTYEDLRKKNRENYLKSRGVNDNLSSSPQIRSQPAIPVKPEEPTVERNKYGDVWT